MYSVLEYCDANGRRPFGRWFDRLDAGPAAKVATAIARMTFGNLGDHKSVGEGVIECRLDFGPGYRLYLGRDGANLVILLLGGIKQGQQRDIAAAKKLWQDYKKRRLVEGD